MEQSAPRGGFVERLRTLMAPKLTVIALPLGPGPASPVRVVPVIFEFLKMPGPPGESQS